MKNDDTPSPTGDDVRPYGTASRIGPRCDADMWDGWRCTLLEGHAGEHDMHGRLNVMGSTAQPISEGEK